MRKRGRGRPRAYDPEVALRAALEVFWARGFAATSLDALSEATGMNRPSLYAAFGDKKSIYLKALKLHRDEMRHLIQAELFAGGTLEEDLLRFYRAALEMYQRGNEVGNIGCPTLCTATAEASDPDIQADLSVALTSLDTAFHKRIRQSPNVAGNSRVLAYVAAAVLQSLAIRVRAGLSKAKADRFVRECVRQLAG